MNTKQSDAQTEKTNNLKTKKKERALPELNWGPTDLQSAALPAELSAL
jgi:hypothetical protein